MKNKIQLCTYADRFGQGDLVTLQNLLNNQFAGVFGGVHLLPFYFPIDGADAGFDPVDHTQVDNRLGGWNNVKDLSESYDVMADVIVNHVSSNSLAFKDYLKNAEDSVYADLFLTYEKVFPTGATQEQLVNLYRPRPGLPFSKIKLANGKEELFWTTFTADQIDIDVFSEAGKNYLLSILDKLEQANVKMIRLDAAGYAVKKAGSRCFMTDETFDFIESFSTMAADRGIEVLVEIHAHYLTQVAIAKKAGWVYDFALPPLLLHTLIAKNSKSLQAWYEISPRNAVTVLDTHDGIGIIDIAAEKGVGSGLLTNDEVNELVENIHSNSGHTSRKATGAAASNLDLYQVNCTYYEALGKDDQAYLLARLIQFFSPGIPQVYYVGLLAGENDMALLEKTGVGRDINRHYYSLDEIESALRRPVVANLIALMKFRNSHPAFQTGVFSCPTTDAEHLQLNWHAENASLELSVDVLAQTFSLRENIDGKTSVVTSWSGF